MRQKIDCTFKNLCCKVFLADLKYKVRIKIHKIIMITVIGLIGIKSGPLAMLTNFASYNNSDQNSFLKIANTNSL